MHALAQAIWPIIRPLILPWLIHELSRLAGRQPGEDEEKYQKRRAAMIEVGQQIVPSMSKKECWDAAKKIQAIIALR